MTAGPRADARLAALPSLLAQVQAAGDGWIGTEERARLDAMGSEKRRGEFIAGHWLARSLAAERLGGAPADYLIDTAADGASRILGKDLQWAVSLSHSNGWVAAALAPFAIGIDLECPRKARDLLALGAEVFSPSEMAVLHRLPEHERAGAFYRFWTVKEAVGKRAGHGLRPELARRQSAIACATEVADVLCWPFGDGWLALAGARGLSAEVHGLPGDAHPLHFRIDTAAS